MPDEGVHEDRHLQILMRALTSQSWSIRECIVCALRRKREKGRDRVSSVLTCPQCGSADLYYEAALITGYKYHCKKCGYIGPFVIEKDIAREILDDLDESGEHGP